MSLINDALKKAQKQREIPPGATPPAGPPGSPPVAQGYPSPGEPFRPAPSASKTPLLLAGAGVIIALSVVATVYLLRPPGGNVAPAQPFQVAVAVPRIQAPPPSPLPAPKPVAVAPAPVVPVNAPATASAPTARPVAVAAVAEPTLPPAPTAAPEPSPVKATYRIQGLVDKFRISGIRLSDTDSKVILNDHLFRVGELIEPTLGLRLTKIEAHALAFTDAEGNSYTKKF